MTGAYLLGGELEAAGGDYTVALQRYQARFKPFFRSAGWFAPRTKLGVRMRTQVTRLMNAPLISTWMVKRLFADRFDPPAGRE